MNEQSSMQTQLTAEEEQYLRDMGDDDGFWRYPAYSSSVSESELLQKVTAQFGAVPSYVERFAQAEQEGA